MNFRTRRRREDATLDLTAMLDFAFNLVLFFVVTTSFAKAKEDANRESPGIQVDLPRSSAQTLLLDKKDVTLWMALDGSVFLDDVPVDMDALRHRLIAAAEADPNTLVIVKADTGVPHGRVVAVMDVARSVGLTRFGIATDLAGAQ